ncbi:uncharacterized protein LOC142225089 [Haematobia irritans]|uniref:uncharacterized protein LOC142225089 n=1 Tax=Haematobia irritans TaxID=7368 RepID=UPI003F5017E8
MSLERYIRFSDRLVEFEASLSDKKNPLTSRYVIETYKEEVKDIWADIRSAYDQCLQDLGQEEDENDGDKKDEDEASEIETVKSKFKSAFATYCRCSERLGSLLNDMSLSNYSTVPNKAQGFTLPPCEIPTFHGDYASWPTFRDMFRAVCIDNPRLSAVEKLFHLNQRTKGEPNDIVRRLPLTDQNFAVAWRNLCSRYENKRVLVNAQLKILFGLSPIQAESGASLKRLQRDINACISMLKLYDIDVDSWGPIFVHICSARLPDVTLTLWEQTLEDKTVIPEWSSLDSFLTNRHRTLESVSEIRTKGPSTSNPNSGDKTNTKPRNVKAFQHQVNAPKCRLCLTEEHFLRKCPNFLAMSVNQRFSEVKRSNLCLNCFSKVHTSKNCTSKNCCLKCHKRHNTLLHREQLPVTAETNLNTTSTADSSLRQFPSTSSNLQSTGMGGGVIQTCFASHSRGVLLGTALVKINHSGLEYVARALIDSGSQGTFISERLFNTLRLPFQRTSATISGLNDSVSAAVHKECSFRLSSMVRDDFEISTSALVVPHLSGSLPSVTFDPNALLNMPRITLADPRFYESSRIDLLIGGDLLPVIMLSGVRQQICGSLLAQETVFGWILTGPIPFESKTSIPKVVSYYCEISLDKEISRFWEVEDLPQKTFFSQADKICENLYASTTTRNKDGRYVVSLPFKEEFLQDMNLGQSRNIAMAQFIRNEARLLRDPSFKSEYDDVLEEYRLLHHMSEVPCPNGLNNPVHYYLPHHAVVRPESTTTKVRVVFNASSPSSDGRSLNDILYTGPVLQKDLVVLILRWRFFRYVFNGDITKMYRQILVKPEHRTFQRILHRRDPKGKIIDYQLDTVTFGVNCAPYLAIRTIMQLADDVQSCYPLASDILRNSMYVDDALAGGHSIATAVECRNQLIEALQSAGFSMKKWTSNSKRILSDLPKDQLLNEDFLEFDDRSTAKTLGVRWNASSDLFYFSVSPISDDGLYTKRRVLSHIAKLFDPAGWLAPTIVIAKIIMQSIWAEGTKWDENISPQSLCNWRKFLEAYSSINSIAVPRWLDYSPGCEVQFHGFSDASEKAYAAALYVRIKGKTSTSVHLICCKTKVAPLKTLSIPRLELCGATLLTEMIDHIIPQLRIHDYTIFCWTDSTIVLSWLAKPPCFWSTFVANRVSKITQVVNPSNWFHVRSENNPADLASRGVYPNDLHNNQLWWHGPPWLANPEYTWPRLDDMTHESIDLERKYIKVHFSYYSDFEDVLDRFSSFPKSVRVVAYMYRFFYNTHPKYRSNFTKQSSNISSAEILQVQKNILIMTQKAYFPNEYLALSAKKGISSSSPILSLNPFIDEEGIMRVCGRLASSPALSYNERHPSILPYNCQLSRLLVRFTHEISIHGGNQLVHRLLRLQFWIIKVKNLIKTTINKCKACILYKQRCQRQMMSALPPERSELSRPFTHTGLDFTGPFDLKNFSGRGCRVTKGYVCVFICFATKAIHLEATTDLSTNTFLAAFSRFVSRRGCPLHLHSDNGTNFVGASKILAREFLLASQQAIETNYGVHNITWHFIPPGAPHMGGLWEAGVKSFKSHFRKVAGNTKHTFEEFQTLLSKIESCLNSRPLCPISQDPSDLSALTPGHFLIGTPILAPIDPKIEDSPIHLVNRWQKLKIIHQHFCIRWKDEYLKELHKRHKWKSPTESIKEGTMVVVKDENLPPNCWRMGRVSKVHPGSDGRVRVVDVTTAKGPITRPITKLVVLPTESLS